MVWKYLPLLHCRRCIVSRAAGEGGGGGCWSGSSGGGSERKRRRRCRKAARTERETISCGRLLALACSAYCCGREGGYLIFPVSLCVWERIGRGG